MSQLRMVQNGDHFFFDQGLTIETSDELSKSYQSNQPFPHLVLDDFLPEAFLRAIISNFPGKEDCTVFKNRKTVEGKRGYRPDHLGNNFCRQYLSLFNSGPFIQLVEQITGATGLIPDPYFEGGGLHEIDSGGKLDIHTDFNLYERLNLVRKINLLIYLNENWKPEYGGNLEFWDDSEKCVSIAPLLNRCVVFDTDKNSLHGHPEPLQCPANRSRRSIAIYYYVSPVDKLDASSLLNADTNYF